VPSLHVQAVLHDEVGEIVNSSTDHSTIIPAAVDDADSCGSLVALTSSDDNLACVTESSSQEVYALHSF
jgi:hypothetical protein